MVGQTCNRNPFDAGGSAALIESITAQWRQTPCVARPMEHDLLELIVAVRSYGSYAHLAIGNPDLKQMVMVREMTGNEAFILVDRENAASKGVTWYDHGNYQDWALAEVIGGQTDLVASLGISATLSRSLELTRPPPEVTAIVNVRYGLTST